MLLLLLLLLERIDPDRGNEPEAASFAVGFKIRSRSASGAFMYASRFSSGVISELRVN